MFESTESLFEYYYEGDVYKQVESDLNNIEEEQVKMGLMRLFKRKKGLGEITHESLFKITYGDLEFSIEEMPLGDTLREAVKVFCRRKGIDAVLVKDEDADEFSRTIIVKDVILHCIKEYADALEQGTPMKRVVILNKL